MRGRQSGSRAGTFLVLAGVTGVLTVTFLAGVWTGRHWPLLRGEAKPPAAAEPAAKGRGPADRPRPADVLPALTFYHELTAPLTAPPPPPRPAKTTRAPELKREPEKTEAAPPTLPAPPSLAATEAGTRFTVQVGAYNLKTPAETLRTTLAAAGHEARVVEADTPSGVRYRVQVGTFSTREAAREAAGRLTAERSLPAFVTTR
jgi:DedD protein